MKKVSKVKTVESVIKRNVGESLNEILYPSKEPFIGNLMEVANYLKAIPKETKISIIGDYDVDGVCSTTILADSLKALGLKPNTRLPKRFSEGYGLSETLIDEVDKGVLITIDNGITAHKAIQKAKMKGLFTIVIDHHLPSDTIPPADLIIDPYLDDCGYQGYCGAGLAYRLAQGLDVNTKEMLVLASIATIADVVPLEGANRALVLDGLETIRKGIMPFGIRKLLEELGIDYKHINEDTYGFNIGPVLNAPGRLYDDGARKAFEVLNLDYKNPRATFKVKALIKVNEIRKELCEQQFILAKTLLDNANTDTSNGIVLYHKEFHQGIVGIVASKLVEEYHVPVLLLCTGKDGTRKGSGRSDRLNLKEILDETKSYLVAYGGHEKAAGATLMKESLEDFTEAFHKAVHEIHTSECNDSTYQYDLELDLDTLEKTMKEVRRFAPYGEGNPKIRFHLSIKLENYKYSTMGEKGDHIKLVHKNIPIFSIVGFHFNEKYKSLSNQKSDIEVIGNLDESWYTGEREIVLRVTAME